MPAYHPDLVVARWIPPVSVGPRLTRLAQRMRTRPGPTPADVSVADLLLPGSGQDARIPVRVYRSRTGHREAALIWLHGGGMILGDHLQDHAYIIGLVRSLGITVVSVGYRLAPQHPAPAALEDAYTALTWLARNAGQMGIDSSRIAVGGRSAGGGLAAGLSLMALDRGTVSPAFQLLLYPMLDDRTALRTDIEPRLRAWTPKSNRWAWTAYLGRAPGGDDISAYAAPARREDLRGLAPAWIGVGTLDLFYDEDVAYADRLVAAGVQCELEAVPGAFHGFDEVMRSKPVSVAFRRRQAEVLAAALLR